MIVMAQLESKAGEAKCPSSVAVFYATACEIERTAPRIVTKGEILGHAVAHEIGHLLLATDAHSLMGIMKDNYDKDDLFAMGKGHLLFGPDEALVIRKRVLSAPGEPHP